MALFKTGNPPLPCQRASKLRWPPAGGSYSPLTFGRRAAAWFTRSSTDCSALPTSAMAAVLIASDT